MTSKFGRISVAIGGAIAAVALFASSAQAETIKIGMLKVAGSAPLYIADAKGYFKQEGLDVEFVYFEAAQAASLAVVAGSVDVGIAALGASQFTLAGRGELTLIAAQAREVPGFPNGAFLVSNKAYDEGLKSFKNMPGHSVAMTNVGSPFHYSLHLISQKYGFALKDMRLLPLQTLPNNVSAVVGGTADMAIAPSTLAVPVLRDGKAKTLGYVGDETPWQLSAVFTSVKTANERGDMLRRFLRAYKKGTKDNYAAFADEKGRRKNMATADETIDILVKYLQLPKPVISNGVQYVDPEARLDVDDVMKQIAWYREQGLVKVEVTQDQIIDKRYVVPLPK